jgi:hypothetical protein
MNKMLVVASLLVLFCALLTACGGGEVTIDIQPPGGSGESTEGAGDMSTTILYGILILAGVAVLIALISLVRR